MDDDRRRFAGNMARFFDVKPNGDGKTLDIGGDRDANVKRAVLAALDDIDSVSDDFAELYRRFAFTQQELEEAVRKCK
ncbi:hypothetical protein [Sulfitobacter pontiacus]|uniref:hypothetical protein n=1 Tax=Sulfitobacter pontiacus TaxID=60137 RepID=UPI0030EC5C20